jgi:hypothetical protein
MAPASHAQVVLDARTLQFTTEAFANFTAGDETESGARGAAADNARFDGGARVLSRLNSHRLSSVRHPVRVSILAVACRRRSYRTRSPCKSIHWYLSVGRPLSSTIKEAGDPTDRRGGGDHQWDEQVVLPIEQGSERERENSRAQWRD